MSAIEYRPSIDGLRAVAVIAVLLFHFTPVLLPGGFVGVDVFFVISGYLITKIINAECERGEFSFSRFYQRRISRIFPVFAAVTFAVLIGASLIYSPQDFASAGAVAIYAAFSATNIKLMGQGNYFKMSPDAQPFLHYWSLAVEEQFYLVFPVLVYFAARWKMSRGKLVVCVALVAMVSLGACVYLTERNSTRAFYLLPTRAWELLAGCLLGLDPFVKAGAYSLGIRRFLSIGGASLLAISIVWIREKMPFPGFVAALPVSGAAMLIACPEASQTLVQRALSYRVCVFIGKISYSLYLWHWPVYCFIDYAWYDRSAIVRLVSKVLITIVLALLSYRLLESPLRSWLNRPERKGLSFSACGIVVVLISVLGYSIRLENYVNVSPDDVLLGGVTFAAAADRPRIVLMGDSHGAMYGKTLKELSREMDFTVHIISTQGNTPLPDSRVYRDSLSFLEKTQPPVTIVVLDWSSKLGKHPERLQTALAAILQHTNQVILITQPPVLPQAASRSGFREQGVHPVREDDVVAAKRQSSNEYVRSLQSDRVKILEIDSLFLTPGGEIRFTDSRGRQNYHDLTHLSGNGADQVKEQLRRELSALLYAGQK
ncbi:MAG: acyltransferase [Planctomycetota bacterium]|nr:MAG: acyltransferase [Planctomycetota bacterium]